VSPPHRSSPLTTGFVLSATCRTGSGRRGAAIEVVEELGRSRSLADGGLRSVEELGRRRAMAGGGARPMEGHGHQLLNRRNLGPLLRQATGSSRSTRREAQESGRDGG